jgi:AcrR family transcriptional regulator
VRYSPEQQEDTRRRILRSVGRGFRSKGFGGIGIDALAKGARVTSGAFYGHFRSKVEAFRASVAAGIDDFTQGVVDFQARCGDRWIEALAEFYFTERVTCDLAEGCALPSLAGEVARSDAKTRGTFEKAYLGLVGAIARGLPAEVTETEERAIAMTALLAGGVIIARAVRQQELRSRIARILQEAVVACARRGWKT